MSKIFVEFRSEYIDIADALFVQTLGVGKMPESSSLTRKYEVESEYHNIRDIRSWLASALECGLIYTGSCVES